MKFAVWILRRIRTTIFGSSFGWIDKYREFIMEEKLGSILVTLICGGVWMLFVFIMAVWLVDYRETARIVLGTAFWCIPAFYIYHWLMALHKIYTNEKHQVWEELKR